MTERTESFLERWTRVIKMPAPTSDQEAYLREREPTPVWVCCGCGKGTPDRIRACECPTGLVYDVNDRSRIAAKRRKPHSYDPACYDLAEHFLANDPPFAKLNTDENRDELAALIQTTIEDHIEYDLKLRRAFGEEPTR